MHCIVIINLPGIYYFFRNVHFDWCRRYFFTSSFKLQTAALATSKSYFIPVLVLVLMLVRASVPVLVSLWCMIGVAKCSIYCVCTRQFLPARLLSLSGGERQRLLGSGAHHSLSLPAHVCGGSEYCIVGSFVLSFNSYFSWENYYKDYNLVPSYKIFFYKYIYIS